MAFQQKIKKKSILKPMLVVGVLIVFIGLVMFTVLAISAEENSVLEERQEDLQGVLAERNEESSEVSLTEEQQKLVESYTDETKAALKILKESAWAEKATNDSIVFNDDSFEELSQSIEQKITSFAVANCHTVEVFNNSSQGKQTTTTLTCLDAQNNYFYLEIIESTLGNSSTQEVDYSISSDRFLAHSTYLKVQAAQNLQINGITEKMIKTLGCSKADLEQQIKEFVQQSYPTASNANVSTVLVVNTDADLYSFDLVLDNSSNTMLKCTYASVSKSFSFKANVSATQIN